MNTLRLSQQLIKDEGLRLKPYRCTAGKLTIGAGRNLDDVGITEDEALYMLDGDIRRVWSTLVISLPWVMDAPEDVQEVLSNMCFNLGLAGLLKFKNTLSLLESKNYREAAEEMMRSTWAQQVGQRAVRLAARIANLEHVRV